uniref:Secreted protein n=1 Tax=Angiostrongylus cantonensis TaxID=6313 RepID=A0A0K0CWX3_ANGCA
MKASCKTTVPEWFCTSALVTRASNLVGTSLLFLDQRRRAATPSGKALGHSRIREVLHGVVVVVLVAIAATATV